VRSAGWAVADGGAPSARPLQAKAGMLLFNIVDVFAPTCLRRCEKISYDSWRWQKTYGFPSKSSAQFMCFHACANFFTPSERDRQLDAPAGVLLPRLRERFGGGKRGHPKYTTYGGKLRSGDTIGSALSDRFGATGSRSQRLGSSVGFGPGDGAPGGIANRQWQIANQGACDNSCPPYT
jgi:hypothetical protein